MNVINNIHLLDIILKMNNNKIIDLYHINKK